MRTFRLSALAVLAMAAAAASAQSPAVLRDLEAKSPVTLTKAQLDELMPGAKISRLANSGTQIWTNEAGGTFTASSDNSTTIRRTTTAPGKWNLSDDGRYCVLIEWKSAGPEEWCRYVLQTSEGYYLTRSTSVGTERVYKVEISK